MEHSNPFPPGPETCAPLAPTGACGLADDLDPPYRELEPEPEAERAVLRVEKCNWPPPPLSLPLLAPRRSLRIRSNCSINKLLAFADLVRDAAFDGVLAALASAAAVA
eukprot:CAMPEP_0117773584 /NCGR_PEP_ID=MMETSP0947-20121206/25936_1 /TAXON_ID=44440 /ORGANISM="Chattonella subsalsa, Strain CCMP2191" /LENGTH=107 /DNA_ID=CAMNT_0005599741 /DNA_START=171 /DNA_END=494 /DNA_ORIENTATION=+